MHLRNIAAAVVILSFMFLGSSTAKASPTPGNGQVSLIHLVNDLSHHEHDIIDDHGRRYRDEDVDHERFHDQQQREHGLFHEEERLRDRDREDDGVVFDLGNGVQIQLDENKRR